MNKNFWKYLASKDHEVQGTAFIHSLYKTSTTKLKGFKRKWMRSSTFKKIQISKTSLPGMTNISFLYFSVNIFSWLLYNNHKDFSSVFLTEYIDR